MRTSKDPAPTSDEFAKVVFYEHASSMNKPSQNLPMCSVDALRNLFCTMQSEGLSNVGAWSHQAWSPSRAFVTDGHSKAPETETHVHCLSIWMV